MKTSIKSLTASILAGMAFITLCGTARADLAVQIPTAYPPAGPTPTNWVTDPGGNSPFYSSANIQIPANFSGQAQQGAAAGAPASVLAETITITNFAGIPAVVANTNYTLTGISMLISGYDGSHAYSLHIFDVTTNLTSNNGTILTGSGATYNFTLNGDLLGGGTGSGVVFTNQYLSGVAQQDYFGLQNGPNSQDQIVLGAGHTYAIEVWFPSGSSTFYAQKCSAVPQDAGGELMASTDSRFTQSRITGSSSGFYGGSQHTWAIALYGYPTNAPRTINTNLVASTNYIIDQFNAFGYGPTNKYVGTNNYSTGGIINVWTNWYGAAWVTNQWDSSSDANNNTPNSGSLKITATFPGQYAVFDGFNGINPPLSCYSNGITSFECDLRFDPSSPVTVNNGTAVTNYGHLQIGTRNGNSQDYWTALEIPVGTTNWVHVSIPLSLSTDPNLFAINDVVFHIDGNWYGSSALSGTSILWVDNVKFVGPATVTLPPLPILTIQKATPGLRIFAGSTANTYDRAEVATIDNNQSWIGGSFPKSYSFTLLSYPANIGQTHIFLVPQNTSGQANMGNVGGSVNEYIEYQATNTLWMVFGPGGGGVVASVQWKTNQPNANPANTVVQITNSTAVGTWTLTFSSATAGTLTAPGASPAAFSLPSDVAAQFANPLVAYFGLQPNQGSGIGQYEDWASISVTGVAGANENDNFTTDTSFNSGLWNINTLTVALNTCVQLVTTNTPYWVNWTLPAVNYGLGTAMSVLGNNNTSGPWMLPEYYNYYNDGNTIPGQANQGSKTWVLIPSTCLPTVDGSQGGVHSPNAFFRLFSPPLAN